MKPYISTLSCFPPLFFGVGGEGSKATQQSVTAKQCNAFKIKPYLLVTLARDPQISIPMTNLAKSLSTGSKPNRHLLYGISEDKI